MFWIQIINNKYGPGKHRSTKLVMFFFIASELTCPGAFEKRNSWHHGGHKIKMFIVYGRKKRWIN